MSLTGVPYIPCNWTGDVNVVCCPGGRRCKKDEEEKETIENTTTETEGNCTLSGHFSCGTHNTLPNIQK